VEVVEHMPQVELTGEMVALEVVEETALEVVAHLVKEILVALEELTLVVVEEAEKVALVLQTLVTQVAMEEMELHHLYQVLQ
jgi:hypothetical protein